MAEEVYMAKLAERDGKFYPSMSGPHSQTHAGAMPTIS